MHGAFYGQYLIFAQNAVKMPGFAAKIGFKMLQYQNLYVILNITIWQKEGKLC